MINIQICKVHVGMKENLALMLATNESTTWTRSQFKLWAEVNNGKESGKRHAIVMVGKSFLFPAYRSVEVQCGRELHHIVHSLRCVGFVPWVMVSNSGYWLACRSFRLRGWSSRLESTLCRVIMKDSVDKWHVIVQSQVELHLDDAQ